MSTHPNAELLQNAYHAAGQGDLGPMLGMLSDDISWTDSTLGPLAGSYRKDQVPEFFARMTGLYHGTLRVEIAGLVADDDLGVVLASESGTVDGTPVAWTDVHVWTFSHSQAPLRQLQLRRIPEVLGRREGRT